MRYTLKQLVECLPRNGDSVNGCDNGGDDGDDSGDDGYVVLALRHTERTFLSGTGNRQLMRVPCLLPWRLLSWRPGGGGSPAF